MKNTDLVRNFFSNWNKEQNQKTQNEVFERLENTLNSLEYENLHNITSTNEVVKNELRNKLQ